MLVCQNNERNTLHNLLHTKSALFSKVNKSDVSTGLKTEQRKTEGAPPEISSVVAVMDAKIVLLALTLASIGALFTASR